MTTDVHAAARARTRALFLRVAAVTAAVLLLAVGGAAALGSHQSPSSTGSGISGLARRLAPAGAGGERTSWVTLAGARLPVSPIAGPRDLSAGRARDFSRDATGAAYAALHLSLRASPEVGPAIYGPTFAQQVIGDGTDALRAEIDAAYGDLQAAAAVPYGRPAGKVRASALGYRVDALDRAMASVRLLMSSTDDYGNPALTTCVVQLRWVEGDWKMLAPPGGDWAPMVALVYSQSGFTPFPSP